jgi:hypothetical protein
LLVVAACTADNPEFDRDVGPTPMQGTDGDGGSSSTSPSSGLVTTDSAGSTSPAGTSGDSVDPGSSGEASEGTSGSDLPGNGCAQNEDAGFKIMVRVSGQDPMEPDCTPFDLFGSVSVHPDGGGLQIADCEGSCECEEPVVLYTIHFGDAGVVPDTFGGCRRVFVWADDGGGAMPCEWTGFSIEPMGGPPLVVGSNRLEVDLPSFESPQLVEGEECGEQGCEDGIPHPGSYALSIDGTPVWPDDEPLEVTLSEGQYAFDNRMSHIREDCFPMVSWRAEAR